LTFYKSNVIIILEKVLLMTVHLIYMRKNDCSTCQVRGGHFFVVLSLLEPIE